MFLKYLNNNIHLWYVFVLTYFYIQYIFLYRLQFSLDETWFETCSSLVKSITKGVCQPVTYTEYQLLITTTLMKTTRDNL